MKMKTTGKKYVVVFAVALVGIAFFIPKILWSETVLSHPGASVLEGSCNCDDHTIILNKPEIKPQLLSNNISKELELPYVPVFTDVAKPRSKKIFKINSQKYGGLRSALQKYSFVGKVGGVAFEAIAIPDDTIKNKSISIKYDKSNPDGCRFSVIVGGAKFRLFAPDWVLIPAANYSNSNDTALVSLFGQDSTKTAHEIVYHESMVDTLLGIRLLQADMLLMGQAPSELFQAEGRELLGYGEKGMAQSDKEKSMLFLQGIRKEMEKIKVRSWVLTDLDIEVLFGIDTATSSFNITGYPYYYFWNVEENDTPKNVEDIERILETLPPEKQEKILAFFSQLQLDPSISPSNEIRELLADTMGPKVIPKKELTDLFKKNRNQIRALNPIVTDATTQLMRLTAFFRYFKESNPSNWRLFLSDIRNVTPEPQIISPTRLDK